MIDRYFDAIQAVIGEIRSKQADSIRKAARMCAESIAGGGVIHIHDTGHMLNSELIHRAGGLAALTPFTFGMNINNPNSFRERTREEPNNCRAGGTTGELVALALKRSNLRPGDVLFVGSVSGKSEQPIEVALRAKEMGISVIAITAVAYSGKLESQHPSGKRLYEVADLVIDNCAPYGDAMLEFDGLDVRACPASGIAAACIMWSISAATIALLLEKGITPTVYKSVNAPGGPEDVQARQERYREKGY